MNNIILELPYKSPSRLKSWITLEQIEVEHWEVMDKICDILFSGKYAENCQEFARNILQFLQDWDFISWKQFDSIMAINPKGKFPHVLMMKDKTKLTEGNYYINIASKKLKFTYVPDYTNSHLSYSLRYMKTDKDMDNVYKQIFGHEPYFEENEEGFQTYYDKDGGRFFGFPDDTKTLIDYI